VPLQDRCFQVVLEPLEFKDSMKLLQRNLQGRENRTGPPVLKRIACQSKGIPRKLINGLFAEIAFGEEDYGSGHDKKVNLRAAK